MEPITCPACNTKVVPTRDGICPACRVLITGEAARKDIIPVRFVAPQFQVFRPLFVQGQGTLEIFNDELIVNASEGSRSSVRIMVYGFVAALILPPILCGFMRLPVDPFGPVGYLVAFTLWGIMTAVLNSRSSGGNKQKKEFRFPLQSISKVHRLEVHQPMAPVLAGNAETGGHVVHAGKQAICFYPLNDSSQTIQFLQNLKDLSG